MVKPIGYRFRPTKEELINNYLRPKNGGGDTRDIDRVISTVNVCSFDPWELSSESVIQSSDQVWYFFGCIEKKYKKGDQQMRKTKSGFWKKTGKTMKIISKSGNPRKKIGEKRVLVFHSKGSKTKTDWVMHEYHLSPLNPMMAYTICKVKFKGAASEISSHPANEISLSSIADINNNSVGLSSGSEVGQSQNLTGFQEESENPRLFSGFLHLEEEAQLEVAIRKAIDSVPIDELNSFINDVEQSNIFSMQEDCSRCRPKQPVTGVMVGHTSDDSDSDSLSATTGSIHTWTTRDSFGSSNHRINQITDLQGSPNSTVELVPITQEVCQVLGPMTEIGDDKLSQETIKKKKGGSFYRMVQRLIKKMNLCSSF